MGTRSLALSNGTLEIVQQMAVENEAGAVVWDAALVLAHYLHKRPYPIEFKGRRVVELGAGTGVVGLSIALLGAQVLLTDFPRMLHLLERNINGNDLSSSAKALPLVWGESVAHLSPPFDFVVASDVVYDDKEFPKLLKTLEELSGPGTKVLMSYEHREGMSGFFDLLKERALIQKVEVDELDQEWVCNDISVMVIQF